MQDDTGPMINIAIEWMESVVALCKVPACDAVRRQVSTQIPKGYKVTFRNI